MYLETAHWQSRGGLLGADRHLAVSGYPRREVYKYPWREGVYVGTFGSIIA